MGQLSHKEDIIGTIGTFVEPYINPTNPTRRGEAKRTVNSIVAKINSVASCVRNEGALPMVVEIEAAWGKEKIKMTDNHD